MMQTLLGKSILVTRPTAQAGRLAALIAELGGEPICFPLLEIYPADDPIALHQAVAMLSSYDVVVFISPNAVKHSVPLILDAGTWPHAVRVAAIGPGTAADLAAYGIGPVIVPHDRFDSEAMLELDVFGVEKITGRRVLILRGNGGRELLADILRQRGARVDAVTCYRRSGPADGAPLLSLLHNNQLDALTISSSEGLRNLFALLDTEASECLRARPVFVPHRRIADVAAEYGLQDVILTAPADAGIIESLCAYNWLHHERYR